MQVLVAIMIRCLKSEHLVAMEVLITNIPSIMISKDMICLQLSGTVLGTLSPVLVELLQEILVPGQQHINDIKIRNNGGVSEIYVAVGDTFYIANKLLFRVVQLWII